MPKFLTSCEMKLVDYDLSKYKPTAFMHKLVSLITYYPHVICMRNDYRPNTMLKYGNCINCIQILNKSELIKLLGIYFTHNNIESFLRQLNKYGFKKKQYNVAIYAHSTFTLDIKDWSQIYIMTPNKLYKNEINTTMQTNILRTDHRLDFQNNDNIIENQKIIKSNQKIIDGKLDEILYLLGGTSK